MLPYNRNNYDEPHCAFLDLRTADPLKNQGTMRQLISLFNDEIYPLLFHRNTYRLHGTYRPRPHPSSSLEIHASLSGLQQKFHRPTSPADKQILPFIQYFVEISIKIYLVLVFSDYFFFHFDKNI